MKLKIFAFVAVLLAVNPIRLPAQPPHPASQLHQQSGWGQSRGRPGLRWPPALWSSPEHGGPNSVGLVFSINPDGTGYTPLHNFTDAPDGSHPLGGVTLSGSTLYGTTSTGGTNNLGTVK